MPTFPELLHISVTTTFQNCWSCSYNMPNATPDDQPTLKGLYRVTTCPWNLYWLLQWNFLHTAWIQWC